MNDARNRPGRQPGKPPRGKPVRVLDVTTAGVTFEQVEAVARAAVARTAVRELDVFAQVVADFRREPDALLRPRRREPVAMGVDFISVTAMTLMIAGALGGVLKNVAGELLVDNLSEPTRRALAQLFQARNNGRHIAGHATDDDRPRPQLQVTVQGLHTGQEVEIALAIKGWTEPSGIDQDAVNLALNSVLIVLKPAAQESVSTASIGPAAIGPAAIGPV